MNKYNMEKIIKMYTGDQNSAIYVLYNIKNTRDVSGEGQLDQYLVFFFLQF